MVDLPELGTAAAAGAAAGRYVTRHPSTPGALSRVLGPSMDVLGDAFGRWTEKRTANVGRIAEKAERKLGGRIHEDADVPPRVAARVLEDGSWCDDDVMQEYLAGVLAGARTTDDSDDRGAMWATIVNDLSAYQVRTHYLIYTALHQLHRAHGFRPDFSTPQGRMQARVVLPLPGYAAAMPGRGGEAAVHATSGLNRVGLLEAWLIAPDAGIVATPSLPGIELFMWAHGLADDHSALVDQDLTPLTETAPIVVAEAWIWSAPPANVPPSVHG